MTTKTFKLSCILLSCALAACSSTSNISSSSDSKLVESIKSADTSHRSQANSARDQYRNPIQTLDFFELKPEHTVVEIWPGAGWYSEIFAPLLKPRGKYYAAHFPANSPIKYFTKNLKKYNNKLNSSAVYQNVILTEFNPAVSAQDAQIAPDNSADRIFTFRNLHNWYINGGEAAAINAYKSFYKALKPGGILGVVDHRMPEHQDQANNKSSGYIKQSLAIKWAEQAGFELVATSEINSNPNDTADHPKGVWTLPPALRLGEQDKAKYLAIGESDRFTLKFKKPI
ncbi:class I SAM-dependent methyltransferase [Catenovulum maritimum]|uniref:Methyltransferase n=1 Tax=Catenovulum maritimum TaxID=1513271 RepID=A0A0J8GSJ9_9ALTE|nr:class I SAM-dependent methyltransferase [Catenovulum maritimum]KMT65712.1 methyltransferase [Catenovulum maritimum]